MNSRATSWGPVWGLFGPLMIALIVGNLLGIADVFWLGRLVGTDGVAVATVVFPVIVLGAQLAVGVSNATAILCSRAVGANDDARFSKVVATSGALILTVAGALTVGVFLAAPALATSLNTPPELLSDTISYLRIESFCFVPLFLYYQLSAVFRARGDAMFQLWGLLAAVAIDVCLVPLFIKGVGPLPTLGTLGTAAANVTAYMLVLIGAVIVLHIKKLPAFGRRKDINSGTIREMSGVALSSTLQVISPAVAGIIMIGLVNQHGVNVIGAFGVAGKIEAILLVPAFAMSMTITALAGNAFGARKPALAWQHLRRGAVLCGAITIPLVLASVVFSRQLTLMMVDDVALVPIVATYLQIMAPAYILNVQLALAVGMLNGDRRMLSGAAVNAIGYLVVSVPVAILLSGTTLQERGIWVAMSVGYALMAALASVLILPSVRQRAIARRRPEAASLDSIASDSETLIAAQVTSATREVDQSEALK